MKAKDFRIYNFVGCKVSNDSGIYQIIGIDGFKRCFKTKEDKVQYYKNDITDLSKYKVVQFVDEMLIRLSGGARDGERYIESKIKGIKLTEEWLVSFGFEISKITGYNGCYNIGLGYYIQMMSNAITLFKETDDNKLTLITGFKYVHELQNLYYALTSIDLVLKS